MSSRAEAKTAHGLFRQQLSVVLQRPDVDRTHSAPVSSVEEDVSAQFVSEGKLACCGAPPKCSLGLGWTNPSGPSGLRRWVGPVFLVLQRLESDTLAALLFGLSLSEVSLEHGSQGAVVQICRPTGGSFSKH